MLWAFSVLAVFSSYSILRANFESLFRSPLLQLVAKVIRGPPARPQGEARFEVCQFSVSVAASPTKHLSLSSPCFVSDLELSALRLSGFEPPLALALVPQRHTMHETPHKEPRRFVSGARSSFDTEDVHPLLLRGQVHSVLDR